MNNDKDLLKYRRAIDSKFSMVDLLSKLNPDNYYEYDKPCFCPFHDNTNTPAAALYSNNDGDSLYCFSERKVYRASDVIEKLYKKDVYEIGAKLFNDLTPSEQKEYLTEKEKINYYSEFAIVSDTTMKQLLERFKNREITLNTYLVSSLKHKKETK